MIMKLKLKTMATQKETNRTMQFFPFIHFYLRPSRSILNFYKYNETMQPINCLSIVYCLFVFAIAAMATTVAVSGNGTAVDGNMSAAAPSLLQPPQTINSLSFLDEMKRLNEQESDPRNIMTPEFRQFCISAREHTACCMAYCVLFLFSYILTRRVSQRIRLVYSAAMTGRPANSRTSNRNKKKRHAAELCRPDTLYSTIFRSRQISLAISAIGLTSLCMTALLLLLTVALANAMEHGDPHSIPSWRNWLLPDSLLTPGEDYITNSSNVSNTLGPQAAHDFPPILRRLWLYQSIISVFTAVFLLPFGLIYEQTSQMRNTSRRLVIALWRWATMAVVVMVGWEVVCNKSSYLRALGFYRLLSHSTSATIRYSVYHGACIFGSLPIVLLIIPRGTWALFSWLRFCVGQKEEMACKARLRYQQFQDEKQRIEDRLQRAIGSWKWEHIQDGDDSWIFVDSRDGSDTDDMGMGLQQLAKPLHPADALPPAHPGLSHSASNTLGRFFSQLSVANRVLSPRHSGSTEACRQYYPEDRPSPSNSDHQENISAAFPRRQAHRTRRPFDSPQFYRSRSPSPSPSVSSATSLSEDFAPVLSDELDMNIDNVSANAIARRREARIAQKQRRRRRDDELERLSTQIKKYHAQLLFIDSEMESLEKSQALTMEDAGSNGQGAADNTALSCKRFAVLVKRAVLILVSAAVALVWVLVVLQIGRGALNAIFVGEPDLTHNFTYFFPALSTAIQDRYLPADIGSTAASSSFPNSSENYSVWSRIIFPTIITGCQAVSGALLFVVVLFGLLSVGTSVEDSLLLPLRFLISTNSGSLLRARQWRWLPYTLLNQSILAVIDPTLAMAMLKANSASNSAVAGHRCQVFFSSSADLTSYYRVLQKQMSPNVKLLPEGIISESFLQAESWGRKVFLLLSSKGSLSVTIKRLLAYVWILCSLSMTWPSVLRTTGLISERAYILPIASLVEPLWMSYANEGDKLTFAPVASMLRNGTSDISVAKGESGGLLGMLLALNQGSPDNFATKSQLKERSLSTKDPDETVAEPGKNEVKQKEKENRTALRISRQELMDLLATDTVWRYLVQWGLKLVHRISPRSSWIAGYAVWWYFPDLIVPLSAETIDYQLGYRQPVLVATPAADQYGVLMTAHSEWHGMLHRIQRQQIKFPQSEDGTPLFLQTTLPAASKNKKAPSVWEATSKHSQVDPEPSISWIAELVGSLSKNLGQPLYTATVYCVRVIFSYLDIIARSLLRRVWQYVQQLVRTLRDLVFLHTSGTRTGAFLEEVERMMFSVMEGYLIASEAVWEGLVSPVVERVGSAASGLYQQAAPVVSKVASATAKAVGSYIFPGFTGDSGQPLHKDVCGAVSAENFAAVPVLFTPDYWEAVVRFGDSLAMQRLRPELWPHVLDAGMNEDHNQQQVLLSSETKLTAIGSGKRKLPDSYSSPNLSQQTTDQAARDKWSVPDWLLAIYRVLLGILALSAIFGPSGTSTGLFAFWQQ